jgi:hypothetical protein
MRAADSRAHCHLCGTPFDSAELKKGSSFQRMLETKSDGNSDKNIEKF